MAHDHTRVYVVGEEEGARDEKLARLMGTLFPCGKLSLLSLDVLLVNFLRPYARAEECNSRSDDDTTVFDSGARLFRVRTYIVLT